MKITEVDNVKKYLKRARFIGFGTMANVFLMEDGNIIKLYRNNLNSYCFLRNKDNALKHFLDIEEVENDTFIAPKELLIKDDKIIGYIAPFSKGHTLARSYLIHVKEILDAYPKLEEDTLKISDKNFMMFDLHTKNISFDGNFHIFDLDKGSIEESTIQNVFNKNMCLLNKSIMASMFGVNDIDYTLEFYNIYLNKHYHDICYFKYHEFKDFVNECLEEMKLDNPTFLELRLKRNSILRKEYIVDYHNRRLF